MWTLSTEEEKINQISYFEKLNNNHATVIYEKNSITTKLYRNKRKLPVHWSSQIPKRYKWSAITSDLNRAACMASVPGNEIPEIKRKFINADYPPRFINSVIKQFSQKTSEIDDFIKPPTLFQIPKKVVLVEIPHFPKNEASSKRFIKKFDELTDSLYDIRIK